MPAEGAGESSPPVPKPGQILPGDPGIRPVPGGFPDPERAWKPGYRSGTGWYPLAGKEKELEDGNLHVSLFGLL